MYTEHPYRGKFEGDCSQKMTEVVYNASLNGFGDNLGDVADFGHYSLVVGKRYTFIVHEDNQGFVTVNSYSHDKGAKRWSEIETAYKAFLA